MKLKEKIENWNEFVFTVSLILLLIFFGMMIDAPAYIHETFGHMMTCERYGGVPSMKKTPEGYQTSCEFPKQTYTKQAKYNFLMSGIYGELILAFVLSCIPVLSVLGAFYLTQISWNLWQGSYSYDLLHASKLFPNSFAGIMLEPGFQIFFLIISVLIFLLSLEYLWMFIKKYLDIPGI